MNALAVVKVVAELRNWLHHGTCKSMYSRGGLGVNGSESKGTWGYVCDEGKPRENAAGDEIAPGKIYQASKCGSRPNR